MHRRRKGGIGMSKRTRYEFIGLLARGDPVPPYPTEYRKYPSGKTIPWSYAIRIYKAVALRERLLFDTLYPEIRVRSNISFIRDSHLSLRRRQPPNPLLEIVKKWEDPETFAPPRPKAA